MQELGLESPAGVTAKLEELERQGKTAFLAAFGDGFAECWA